MRELERERERSVTTHAVARLESDAAAAAEALLADASSEAASAAFKTLACEA